MAVIIAGVVIVGLVAGLWFLGRPLLDRVKGGSAPQATPTRTVTTQPTSNATKPGGGATRTSRLPSATPTRDPEQAAKAELDGMITESGRVVPRDGRWVAMMSGKWIGITDPMQTTSSGSHTFMAVDILAEHQSIKQWAEGMGGAHVVLMDSRIFGEYVNHNGEPLYVTLALNDGFVDRQAVLDWCATVYPQYSGDALENRCTSARLTA